MYRFNIILTELCNANCSHCYMSAGSKNQKKTMTEEQINKIINNIPDNTDTVVLTGGEVFVVKNLLYYAISLIKHKNTDIIIGVESNGKYLYMNDNPKEEFRMLKKYGVDFIRFSDDVFHQSGGINLSKVLDLKKYEDETTPRIIFLKQDTAIPLGEAEKLPEEYRAKNNCMNNINSVRNPYIFVDAYGNANLCTWKCIPPIGNMISDDFKMIENRLREEFYNYILKGEIEEAISRKTGKNTSELKKESKTAGQCSLCIKYLRG